MTDFRRLLREGDPVAQEPPLARADIDRMRHAVPTAARASRARLSIPSFVLVAATLAATAACVVLTWEYRGPVVPTPVRGATRADATAEAPARRQLQFATPGGTRVIWTFDPNFEMR